jgi:hypothetical protein
MRNRDDLRRRLVAAAVAPDLSHRERARLAAVPQRLGRRDLRRLILTLDLAELVADRQLDRDHRDQHDQRHLRSAMKRLDVALLAQIPRGHREHHQAPGDQQREDHVRVTHTNVGFTNSAHMLVSTGSPDLLSL